MTAAAGRNVLATLAVESGIIRSDEGRDMATEPKPGLKTTELWLSVAAIIVAAVLSFSPDLLSLFPEGSLEAGIVSAVAKLAGILGAVLTALGYTVARAVAKSSEAQTAAIVFAGESNERIARIEQTTAETWQTAVAKGAVSPGSVRQAAAKPAEDHSGGDLLGI